jgi:hypothetical protein
VNLSAEDFFSFCTDCGRIICLNCANRHYRKKYTEKWSVGLRGPYSKSIRYRIPKCTECIGVYDDMIKKSKARFRIYSLVIWMIFSLILLSTIPWIAEASTHEKTACTVGMMIASIPAALLLSYLVNDYRLMKLKKQMPYINKMDITCPVCGKNSEKDMFYTADEYLRQKKEGWSDKIIDRAFDYLFKIIPKEVPDVLRCSTCDYAGPESLGIGLRLHVYHNRSIQLLKGSYWEQHGRQAYKLLFGTEPDPNGRPAPPQRIPHEKVPTLQRMEQRPFR